MAAAGIMAFAVEEPDFNTNTDAADATSNTARAVIAATAAAAAPDAATRELTLKISPS